MGSKDRVLRRVDRHRCGKFPCAEPTCEHYRTPLEIELNAEVRALIKSKLPQGTRVRMGESPFWEVRITCSGSVTDMAYACCLKPGHEGRCYCEYKSVNFTADHY